MKHKKLLSLLLLSSLLLFCMTACGDKEKDNNPNYNSDNYLSGYHYAQMDVDNYGSIIMILDANSAPATVTNFVNLVNEGFYNGLTFHRVIDGYLIQGGDPEGDSSGGATYTVPGEFSDNGFFNPISHIRGTISMARTGKDYDSASSQFFIVQEDTTELDGSYAGFGMVLSGMEIVDAICQNVISEDDNGTVLPENQPIITSITMLPEDYFTEDSSNTTKHIPAEGKITFSIVKNIEDVDVEASLVVNENGDTFLISYSVDLLGLSLYEVDLANGLDLSKSTLLTSYGDIGADSFISLQVTVPENQLNLLLVAEEHNGAVSEYLLCHDSANEDVYLVPVMN